MVSGELGERLLAQDPQPVLAAAGELAGDREGRALRTDPGGHAQVVLMVRGAGADGEADRLIQRPAQQRRPLPGQTGPFEPLASAGRRSLK